ncbi:glycoside hydrolase [Mycobacterium sp. ITM-2017-0098]|nr:glycoside hydrolase [Mycobacterium sp. ITM-2017-0098]
MGRNVLAKVSSRWAAVALSLVVSGAMIYAQQAQPAATEHHEPVAAEPPAPQAAPPVTPVPTEAELLAAASTPVDARVFELALPKGIAPEGGLQVKTIWLARAISSMFPEITTIGGYRQDALKWHPNGLAIDVMIPDHNSEEGIALGNQIAGYALANAERMGVIHVIWRQGFYPGIGAPSWTADYGSETLNHFDHVHIATDGGGYPTGDERYFIGSMRR